MSPSFESWRSANEWATLTLGAHRSVDAIKSFFGHRLVRVAQTECDIYLAVTSRAAQEYWVKSLQPPAEHGSPSMLQRATTTRVSSSFIHELINRTYPLCEVPVAQPCNGKLRHESGTSSNTTSAQSFQMTPADEDCNVFYLPPIVQPPSKPCIHTTDL